MKLSHGPRKAGRTLPPDVSRYWRCSSRPWAREGGRAFLLRTWRRKQRKLPQTRLTSYGGFPSQRLIPALRNRALDHRWPSLRVDGEQLFRRRYSQTAPRYGIA